MALRAMKVTGLILLALIAAIVVSKHAVGNHAGELYSSMDIYYLLEAQVTGPGKGPCVQLVVASCPFAKVQDRSNPRFGEPSPHVKALCQLRAGSKESSPWALGIIGLGAGDTNPIYVTGYVVSYQRASHLLQRDRCLPADVTLIQNLFIPPGMQSQ